MVTVFHIRDRLSQWFDGKISLRQFEDWFVPATWDAHASGNARLEALVDEIELNLSEYTDRVIDLDQLRKELAKAIAPFGRSWCASNDLKGIPGTISGSVRTGPSIKNEELPLRRPPQSATQSVLLCLRPAGEPA